MSSRFFLISSALILSAFIYFNCHGKNKEQKNDTSSSEGEAEEGVSVTAEVGEDDSVEFVQAGESVQIGGTNLTQSSRKVIVWQLEFSATGVQENIIAEVAFEGNSFELKKLPFKSFLRFDIDGIRGAVLQPIISETAEKSIKTKIVFDGDMTVAAKIYELIIAKAKSGNSVARQIIEEQSLNIIDLVSVGGALRGGRKNRESTIPGVEVDLNLAATVMIDSTKALVESLPDISRSDFAQILSTTCQQTLYSTVSSGTSNSAVVAQIGVLIVDKKIQEKTSTDHAESLNPGFNTVKKIAATSVEVLAAYIAAQEVATTQLGSFSTTGQISESSQQDTAAKTKENIEKYTADPSLVESVQPYEISAEAYDSFSTAAAQTSDPTPTDSGTMTSEPTDSGTTPTDSGTMTSDPTDPGSTPTDSGDTGTMTSDPTPTDTMGTPTPTMTP